MGARLRLAAAAGRRRRPPPAAVLFSGRDYCTGSAGTRPRWRCIKGRRRRAHMANPYTVPLGGLMQTDGFGDGLFRSGCPLCTPEDSAEDVVSETKRLSRRVSPESTDKRRRALVHELGNCHAILKCASDEIADVKDHWAASKFQTQREGMTESEERDYKDMCDTLCKSEVDELSNGLEFTNTRMKIIEEQKETLERQAEDDTATDPQNRLYAGCTSEVKGARAKHYMCHRCYEAWIETDRQKTCPWCRKHFLSVRRLETPQVYHSNP